MHIHIYILSLPVNAISLIRCNVHEIVCTLYHTNATRTSNTKILPSQRAIRAIKRRSYSGTRVCMCACACVHGTFIRLKSKREKKMEKKKKEKKKQERQERRKVRVSQSSNSGSRGGPIANLLLRRAGVIIHIYINIYI